METADNCRRAAREAVADVEPPQLHELVETVLDEASMVPGVLTVKSAALVAAETNANGNGTGTDTETGDGTAARDPRAVEPTDDATDALLTHAAGVQLIYEGLRLTRTLAHDEPWLETAGDDGAAVDGDLEILAADILVARGFYLLARTDAAGTAVRTVQSFGRDQTRRTELAATTASADAPSPSADPTAIDANLERDILELAVQTGAAAVDESASGRALGLAAELADTVGPSFPPAAECLAELDISPTTSSEGRDLEFDDRSLEDRATDRATSATDP